MKRFEWSQKKNEWLKINRGVSFDEVYDAILHKKTIAQIPNPSRNFPNQEAFIIKIDDYIYVVPFVEDAEKFFLKTIYPSRKLTRLYLKKERYEKK